MASSSVASSGGHALASKSAEGAFGRRVLTSRCKEEEVRGAANCPLQQMSHEHDKGWGGWNL